MQNATTALAPLTDALQADGYILTIEEMLPDLQLTVAATPDACAECLIPKNVFKDMAAMALKDGGVQVTGDIKIVYPDVHHES